MIILTGCFFAAYYLFLIVLLFGWKRNFKHCERLQENKSFVSVIISARNEEKNIPQLLNDLELQTYKNFEVIVVDDHSGDNSIAAVKSLNLPFVTCYRNNGEGKKKAITTGIEVSKGDIIVTTDADCRVPIRWLESIVTYFGDPKLMLLSGGVRMEEKQNLFSKMQQVEFASLVGSGAATAGLKIPTMCNGANLAYRKEAFQSVKGFEGNLNIASGDDEFLMRKILKHYPNSIQFLADANAVVQTKPQPSLSSFFAQRLRWAGKWKFNTSVYTLLLAFFVFAFQVIIVFSWVKLMASGTQVIGLLLILKIMLEAWVLILFCRFLQIKWDWGAYLLLQIIYPVYVVAVALGANFLTYEWKGRRYLKT